MLLKTAVRNSKKYLRRSIVIVVCIAVSVIAMQMGDSFGEGFKRSALRILLKKEGMILFEPKDDEPLDFAVHSITEYEEIKEKIKEIIPGASITGIIWSPAMVINDSFSIETAIFSEDDLTRTILGSKTAEILNTTAGDTIILMGTNRYGGLSVFSTAIETTLINYRSIREGRGIMVPISQARYFLAWDHDEVKRIKVNFSDYWNSDDYVTQLKPTFPDLKITSWKERLTNIEALFRVTDIKMNIFAAIILIVVAGIIMNTVLTSVLERKKDIGTLRSIGASRSFVVLLILIEILFVAFIGALVGTGFSYLITDHLSRTGISMESVAGMVEYIESTLYPEIVWKNWIASIGFALLWATIFSAYPVLYIVRMRPVEALREV
ncbi:ABC transporter permease [candidate division WOR-3 bacterium]|nr:ABC transporter permease [candidate division WOR-3 bacterium]